MEFHSHLWAKSRLGVKDGAVIDEIRASSTRLLNMTQMPYD